MWLVALLTLTVNGDRDQQAIVQLQHIQRPERTSVEYSHWTQLTAEADRHRRIGSYYTVSASGTRSLQ